MKNIFLLSLIVISVFSSENIILTNDTNFNLYIKEHLGNLVTYIGFAITFITFLFIERQSKRKSKRNSGSILFIGIIASLFIGSLFEIMKYNIFN